MGMSGADIGTIQTRSADRADWPPDALHSLGSASGGSFRRPLFHVSAVASLGCFMVCSPRFITGQFVELFRPSVSTWDTFTLADSSEFYCPQFICFFFFIVLVFVWTCVKSFLIVVVTCFEVEFFLRILYSFCEETITLFSTFVGFGTVQRETNNSPTELILGIMFSFSVFLFGKSLILHLQ